MRGGEGVPGLLVAGRYRLVESIGEGGMGRVWRAVDEMLDRLVAVKEMRMDGIDVEDSRTRRERTLREARATARIDHPHVVRVYDVVDESERLWIVMELVAGRSLERITAETGPLGPRETARIGLGLVAALRQVHARGVLHRDIKPGNVLVEDAGQRVVLTDFGIAALQDAKALTIVGMLVGSPDYMAPERIAGRPQGPPSDIWSLGATLCAALDGHSPFSRETTLATLHAVLYEEPQLPAHVGQLREILAASLEKEPTLRAGLWRLLLLKLGLLLGAFQEAQQLHREGQYEGGVLLGGHRNHRLEEPELECGGGVLHLLGRLGELLRRLEFRVRVDDPGPPFTVGLGLAGHRTLHRVGQRHILDLHPVDLHAPAHRRTVDHQLQALVELLPVGQQIVQLALADDRPQGGLRHL